MSNRPETGPMKFGDDWRGIFIRGDDAFGYAQHLRRIVKLGNMPGIPRMVVDGLVRLLESSTEGTAQNLVAEPTPDSAVQRMRPFVEARKP